jgi:hypothetical protein
MFVNRHCNFEDRNEMKKEARKISKCRDITMKYNVCGM